MIDGVRLVELIRHIDDRVLAVRNHPRHRRVPPKFGENYVVCSPARGTIRGFHEHLVLWDYLWVVRGAATSVSADAAEEVVEAAADKGEPWIPAALEAYILSERKPSLLVVPAGIWHGWKALEEEPMVVANGSEVYNRENPDEVRVPPEVFADTYTVRGR